MSRNGSGTYVPPSNSWSPAVNGTLAVTADWNALLTDIVAALTQSVSKDGQTVMTGSLDMGGFNLTNVASAAIATITGATIVSPSLTGTPTAPTASIGTATTQIATTAFVAAAAFSSALPGQTGNGGKFITTDGTNASWGDAPTGQINRLINGQFAINQRAPTTNADDTYAHDRWYALTQTGTIAVSTVNNAENGTPFMARLTQSQAVAQRMGYAQIIEGINCRDLRGKTVTFRFGRTRLSTSANIRIAVLEWTGTQDAVTSDVVLDWTSGTYTAGNFFLASNLTVSGVVQQALTANTLTDGSSVTVTLGSSFNNLIVFAWTEGTVAQNVTLDLAKAQIENGSFATAFEQRSYGLELSLCQRYYVRIKPTGSSDVLCVGFNGSTGLTNYYVPFPVQMRTGPSALEQTGTATDYQIRYLSADVVCSAVPTYVNASAFAGWVRFTDGTTVLTAGQGSIGRAATANAYLGFSAEL